MLRRLIILLLIVGCVFGDTKVYNNDFLMFKRTKTLNKVEYIGIEEFKGKPVVKILIQSSTLGNQYTFISCDKIIELKNYNGEPIDYDCININNPINSPPPKDSTELNPYLGGICIAIGGGILAYQNNLDIEDRDDSHKTNNTIGYALIGLGGLIMALEPN